MITIQKEITLPKFNRGFHLITDIVLDSVQAINNVSTGLVNVFIKHTSASITINENTDHTVREDMEAYFNESVPENRDYYQHIDEGPDDMPAHIKTSLLGTSVTIPISNGKLNLGIWQGVYLCEHRNRASARKLVITLMGSK